MESSYYGPHTAIGEPTELDRLEAENRELRAERDAAWNEAIEAALQSVRGFRDPDDATSQIASLKREVMP